MEKDAKIFHHRQQQQERKKLACVTLLGLSFVVGVTWTLSLFQNERVITTIEQQQQHPQGGGGGGLRMVMEQKAHELVVATTNDLAAKRVHELESIYHTLEDKVRAIKKTGVIMETDPESLEATHKLQEAARKVIVAKYGKGPYRVQVDLEFPKTIPDYKEHGKYGKIVIEMAPINLIPVSVYTFLEVARTWVRGAFHRNAGHVLQVQVESSEIKQHLPFQEYSPEFPHKKGTTGYCGRPSGPCWYVSIQDNTVNHGPGSQQKKNPHEADANFGRVVEGFDDVVPRIHSIPQMGWLDKQNQIKIIKKTILIPDDNENNGGWKEWEDFTVGVDTS